MMQQLIARMGDAGAWPREPDAALLLIDRFIERNMLEEDPSKRRSVAVLFDYAQYLVPAGDLGGMARSQGANLIRFLGWARNPFIKRCNIAFCLIAEKLAEINDRLVRSPHVATIEVPLPDQPARENFIRGAAEGSDWTALSDFAPQQMAELTAGLSLVNLNLLIAQARPAPNRPGKRIDGATFKRLKKTMIERQCQGLLEFVEPKHTLDLVVGSEPAKQRLREDAELMLRGHLEFAPMGYLVCGPVGTGKTFLAECYAGSIGIPCVKLRNFRSKYVGETEGNLEQVLTVLRSLGPVVVIIDEADAALGNRSAEGDSGTSSRVFSMIASQMGDTTYRGMIVWMLLTSRPDLLPIDLKRQGRAEVHIPLFYPQTADEVRRMFMAMARKNKLPLQESDLPPMEAGGQLSGADIESIALAAQRHALNEKRQALTREDIERAAKEFIPSAQGLEKEMQELAAVLECTQMSFLPDDWREKLAGPEGKAGLQQRFNAIRQAIEAM